MNWPLLQNSLLVAGTTTALAAGLGFVAALWLATLAARWRNVFLALAVVALALPPFLVTNCWLDLLGEAGVWQGWFPFKIYSLAGSVWVLSLMLWPVATLLVLSGWRRLEAAQLEADPAVTGWALLHGLLLPVARGEVALAAVLTFVLALNNFAVPAILQTKVLPDEIWIRFNTAFDTAGALKASLPLVMAPIVLLALLRRREVEWPRLQGTVPARIFKRQLGAGWSWACGTFSFALCAVSVGLPIAEIASARRTWTELGGAVMAGTDAIRNSFWFAALAATVVIAVALMVATSHSQRRDAENAEGRRENSLLGASSAFFVSLRLGLVWLPFLIPGVLLGIALIHLFNNGVLTAFYQSVGIVVLAFGIRYFALGWSGARQAVRTVDRDLTDAAILEGATRWQMMRHVLWPQIAPQVLAAWYVVYLLCLWDVESMILVYPPGSETLALRIFNLLHYGHNAQVNALCLTLLGLAMAPLLIWHAVTRITRRTSDIQESSKHQHPSTREVPSSKFQTLRVAASLGVWYLKFPWMLLLGAWCFCLGCTPSASKNESTLQSKYFERVQIIGSRGVGVGQFNKPRSVAVDKQDNLYVVDMTGRVQKFSPDGKFILSWQMPQTDLGKPKGMGCDRDGNIIVVEPHYQRINHFSPDGKLVAQWGTHGTNEGQFTLPRSVAVNSRGEILVSEYTVVDRVQRFRLQRAEGGGQKLEENARPHLEPATNQPTPDPSQEGNHPTLRRSPPGRGEGWVHGVSARNSFSGKSQPVSLPQDRENTSPTPVEWLGSFGQAGTGNGEFNRPEGLGIGPDDRIYLADSCNHRIQIFSPDGKWLRSYGRAGSGKGELSYPYDVRVDAAGNQFVCEFGNSRIQVFDAHDRPVEILGRPGSAPGEFSNPWAIALDSRGNLYVADAGNHRVQKFFRRATVAADVRRRLGISAIAMAREKSDRLLTSAATKSE
ncbi:MAG: ABC transporter permease subunit [Verrucomicrobia bacterium]|nr:ABC transporter permease subunit [Verrucomicrobiota bacterium]